MGQGKMLIGGDASMCNKIPNHIDGSICDHDRTCSDTGALLSTNSAKY